MIPLMVAHSVSHPQAVKTESRQLGNNLFCEDNRREGVKNGGEELCRAVQEIGVWLSFSSRPRKSGKLLYILVLVERQILPT